MTDDSTIDLIEQRAPMPPAGGNGQVVVYFVAADGSTAGAPLVPNQGSWIKQILCAHCCPWFVGGLLSMDRLNELKRTPMRSVFWITVVQLIMFLVSLCVDGFASLSANPQLGPTTYGLDACGAKDVYKIVHNKHIHRLFTAMLLHAGLIHLVINVLAQLRVAVHAEHKWGTIKFLAVYLLSGLAGTLLSSIINSEHITTAASAGTVGVLAALFINLYLNPDPRDPLRQFIYLQLGLFAILMLLEGLSTLVDFSAHVGAALMGLLLGTMFWGSNITWLSHIAWLKKAFPFILAGVAFLYFLIGIIILFSAVRVDNFWPEVDSE